MLAVLYGRSILIYLPSKKFLVTLGSLFLFALAGWFWFSYRPHYEAPRPSETAMALETQKEALAKDSDNDGLKDWEEVLWKTDTHQADTDGDGTNDKDEVAASRNPL